MREEHFKFEPFPRGDRLYTSASDVRRYTSASDVCRQMLKYNDGPRTKRMKIFLTAVDPWHRHSNESERAKYDLWLFQIGENPFGFHGLYRNIWAP